MICKNCGAQMKDDAKFCPKCGTQNDLISAPQPATISNDKPLVDLSHIWPEWKVEKLLGKGSFGSVYKAIRNDNNVESRAAIKIISIPSDASEVDSLRSEGLDDNGTRTYFKGIVDDFVNEIQLMESLKGIQNIVSVEDYKVLEKQNEIGWDIYIRMELLTPFYNYVGNNTMSEKDVIQLGCDICTALEVCSKRNIIHRDIKPENIFVNDFGDFKLGDFGIARKLENVTGALSQKGTFNYMAPEIANCKEYDARVDTYSLGIVLYRLLNDNKLPFLSNDQQVANPTERKAAVERRILGEALPAPCKASPAMADVILRACAHDPAKRFASATQMKNALTDVKNGTYVMSASDLDQTTAVHHMPTNDYDATVSVQKAPASNEPNAVAPISSFTDEAPKKKKSSKAKKAKIIFISILVAIVAIAIALVAFYFTSSGYKVAQDVKDGNCDTALADYYAEVEDNFIQEFILEKNLTGYDDTVVDTFKKGNMTYDEAVEALEAMEKMGFKGSADRISEITSAKESDGALKSGDEYYEKGDYENAIKEYSKVGEDSNSYTIAQAKLAELYPKYIATVVETAKGYNSSQNYEQAITFVDTAYDILPEGVDTTELDKIKNESLTTYKSNILNKVTAYVNEGQFVAAMELLDEAIKVDDNEEFRNTKTTTENKYVASVTTTVNSYLDKKDYNGALKTVQKALAVLPGNAELTKLQTKVVSETPTYLKDLVLIDSKDYAYSEEVFTDSFGNIYDGYHLFDPCYYNAYAIYNLDEKYTKFNCSIVATPSTGSDRVLGVAIYLDGKLAYTLSDFTKTTGRKDITIDVTNITKLEIKTSADEYANSFLAMVNASVK